MSATISPPAPTEAAYLHLLFSAFSCAGAGELSVCCPAPPSAALSADAWSNEREREWEKSTALFAPFQKKANDM